jgi:chromosome segregation ATPase
LELNAQRSHLQQLNQRIQELEQEKSKPQQQETIEEEVPDESIQKLQRELKESKLENQQEVDALEFSKLKTQAQLDQQTEVANTLQEELAEHKINLQEQQILIDTQALSMQTKEKLIQLLEAQLEGQTQTQRRLLGEDEYSSDELVKTKQAWNDSQLQVQQLQGEHKKARKQIRNLETELDEQLSEWRVMEKDMEDAQARVGTLQAQLAAKEKDPTRTNIAFKENSVNEHLDRLSRKMVEARSQLEEVHRRRKQNLMQQERRVAPVDVLSSARTR